jgi:hypothetical protein
MNSDVLCDYDLSALALPNNSLAHLLLIDNPEHNPNGDFSLTVHPDTTKIYFIPFSKNKVKHKQRAQYICVDLGINRYYICTEKEHYNCL